MCESSPGHSPLQATPFRRLRRAFRIQGIVSDAVACLPQTRSGAWLDELRADIRRHSAAVDSAPRPQGHAALRDTPGSVVRSLFSRENLKTLLETLALEETQHLPRRERA